MKRVLDQNNKFETNSDTAKNTHRLNILDSLQKPAGNNNVSSMLAKKNP